MQQQDKNPQQENRKHQTGHQQSERMNTNNPATGQPERKENDDYRREGAHLGASSSESSGTNSNVSNTRNTSDTSANKQSGGGATGYDVNREMQPIREQQEQMHQERNQDDLQIERTQTPRTEPDPGREEPAPARPQQPDTPQRETPQRETPQPDTNPTTGSASGDIFSQSGWDPNAIR